MLRQILSGFSNTKQITERYEEKLKEDQRSKNEKAVKKSKESRDAIRDSFNMIIGWAELFIRDVFVTRSKDCQTFIRKSVLDYIQQNSVIFFPEVFNADLESVQLVLESVFLGVRDEMALKKLSLANIFSLLQRSEKLSRTQNVMFLKMVKKFKFELKK